MKRTGILVAVMALLLAAGPIRAQDAAPAAAEAAKAAAPAEAAEAQAPAPPARARPQISPELRRVLDKLDEANAKLTDVRARVTYTRVIPLLDDKRKSKGDLAFKKPNLLALILKRPRNEEVRTNGRTWWIVSHNDKRVEVYRAAAEGKGDREAAFLAFGYGQNSEKLLQDYDVDLLGVTPPEDKDGVTVYRLKFTPVERPDQPARYAAIEVEIADDLWLPRVLILHEKGEEIVHTYELSKTELNKGVDDKEFEYEPPKDYEVVPVDQG
jgi:outer membrane lipoprotein-sorting protein